VLLTSLAGAQTAPSTPALQSYFKARAVLDAGIRAVGSLEALRAVRTVRREMAGDWFGSGQNQRPYLATAPTLTPPPSNSQTKLSSFIDYEGRRWLDEAIESDSSGDYIVRLTAAAAGHGFETITFRDEKPLYRAFSDPDLTSIRTRRFRRHPEGLLLMAVERPESLQWLGPAKALGREQRVISLTDPLGTVVILYFDANTGLLTKSETLRDHSIAGDSFSEVIYRDYRQVGNLKLPFHYLDRVGGIPYEEMRVSSIELNAPFPEDRFRAPQDFVAIENDPAEPSVQQFGEGLYLIRGPYNCMFAVFRDHVVVFEAPINGAYAENCLKFIRATVPNKPIRYLVSTHFHFDHIAGVRTYAANGIPIITTPDAKGVIERSVARRHTMRPDGLSHNPANSRIETVSGKRILDDGANRAELYDFGPTAHVSQLLVVYFPRQRVLFEADVWDPISAELPIGGTDTVNMAKKIQQLGLEVECIVPVHGIPGTKEMLDRGLAIRAKYMK
jgi:glyoxylase-like metal-dependent hydrolase (beta-lactamase superfamily II)